MTRNRLCRPGNGGNKLERGPTLKSLNPQQHGGEMLSLSLQRNNREVREMFPYLSLEGTRISRTCIASGLNGVSASCMSRFPCTPGKTI